MGKPPRTQNCRRRREEPLSEDEIDAFNDAKTDLKMLDSAGNPEQDSDHSGSDHDDRDVAFGQLTSSSESEDSEEEDERRKDYEAEKDVARVGKKWGKRSADYFKSGEISDGDERSEGSDADGDSDDGEAARREEEEEAMRIKRKQLQRLSDADFGILNADEDGKKGMEKRKEGAVTVRMKGKRSIGVDSVAEESPEVLGLVAELNRNVEVLQKQISPLLDALKSQNAKEKEKEKLKESVTKQGNSYLEAKFHVLLSYCINITFYLLMKAKNASIKDHPVVQELVRLRTTMDKLRPLDAKLKPQFQRLIHQAVAPSKKPNLDDRIAHRPDADDLVDEDDAEDDEADVDTEKSQSQGKNKKQEKEKYSIPKLAAVPFDEDTSRTAKEKKIQSQRAARAKKSQFLNDLREEFSERPMEQAAIGTEAKHSSARDEDEDRRRFEEANFMRLRETKQQRSARRKREKEAEEGLTRSLAEFESFEGMGMGEESSRTDRDDFADEADRAEALRRFMRKVEGSSQSRQEKKKKGSRSGDAIMKQKDPMLLEMNSMKGMMSGFDEDGDDNDVVANGGKKKARKVADIRVNSEDEDELYQEVKKLRRKRKREREEKYHVDRPVMHEPSRMVEDGDLRGASYKILKNRGLTAHKKKEDKNPRVKMRKKYEKKMKARKGQVRAMRQAEDVNYLGEASGLRSNLVRSRKIGKTK